MSLHDTLKALSDPVRRDILELLKHGQLSAGDIGKHFELLPDIPNPRCILLQAVHGETDMLAVQLQ